MKRQLRAKRKELGQKLRRNRAVARERLSELARPSRSRRRLRLLLLTLGAVLALLLVRHCGCDPQGAPPTVQSVPRAEAVSQKAALSQRPLTGRLGSRSRPEYRGAAPGPRPWLAAFRLQVASRSVRLAACFEGAQRPGAIKWTAAVEPTRGVVADHVLEPTLAGEDLTASQRECVVGVLSNPPYRLQAGDEPATPSRVGIVIEF